MRFFDASTLTDLPLPFQTLAELAVALRRHSASFVLVGAAARDLLGSGAGRLPVTRATTDVDIAIAVAAMAGYPGIESLLPAGPHPRFVFRGMMVDLLPFGPVEEGRAVLLNGTHRLDVTGLAESAASAVTVALPGGTSIPVASLAAQCGLKLLAWRDRGDFAHRKDALDLALLLRAASSGTYEDALWLDPALDGYDYDLALAGAHVLGRQTATAFGDDARLAVRQVIADEARRTRLGAAMSWRLAGAALQAYLSGLDEVS